MKRLRKPNGDKYEHRCVTCGTPIEWVPQFITNYGRTVSNWEHLFKTECLFARHPDDEEVTVPPTTLRTGVEVARTRVLLFDMRGELVHESAEMPLSSVRHLSPGDELTVEFKVKVDQ